ncbi:MAG TPA: Na+/H+ antiporter subunit E [Pseudomonas sabulinigri]|uniref:Na+/H+ antiporter subunit E n=1 Tax=marine sediment metagenome TaxID=412755 RepID=A0A0F9VGD7_9ZZZZ|nr:Na+/H+ antiporter subunit E [Halopseudomonas sabulinigri]HEC52975.1 Na+/H+ antiporter subunit E [Halopseudomonas sabulinigri]
MSLLKRVLPHPWLSLSMLIGWQLLMNQVSAGSLIMGAILACLIPWMTNVFWPNPPRACRVDRLFLFVCRVLIDIVVANLQVAKLILGPRRELRPAFVLFPLTLEHEFSISVLASTISLTPGTVSADISADRKTLLIHGLDVGDEQALIEHIRRRYEQPLKEVFECSKR